MYEWACLYDIYAKDEQGIFFNGPIQLNPTTNTPIPDRLARFVFFSPDCKISW